MGYCCSKGSLSILPFGHFVEADSQAFSCGVFDSNSHACDPPEGLRKKNCVIRVVENFEKVDVPARTCVCACSSRERLSNTIERQASLEQRNRAHKFFAVSMVACNVHPTAHQPQPHMIIS